LRACRFLLDQRKGPRIGLSIEYYSRAATRYMRIETGIFRVQGNKIAVAGIAVFGQLIAKRMVELDNHCPPREPREKLPGLD